MELSLHGLLQILTKELDLPIQNKMNGAASAIKRNL